MRTTPVTERGRISLQRIVQAACELFYLQGVSATGLAEVTERSGTGKGQLYHYFDDKDDLILTVIEAQIELAITLIRDDLDAISTADDLRAWGSKLVAMHTHDGPVRCPLGALVTELADGDPEFRAALDQGFGRWHDAIATALRRLQRAGEILSDRDADDLAEIILSAYEGGILLSEVHGTPRSLELALSFAIDHVASANRGGSPPSGRGSWDQRSSTPSSVPGGAIN